MDGYGKILVWLIFCGLLEIKWFIRVFDVGVIFVGLEMCWVRLKDCKVLVYCEINGLEILNILIFIFFVIINMFF